MSLSPGETVNATNAFGQKLERVALTGVVAGHDFPVVWVCHPDEWEASQREGREPEGVPWPAEDVSRAELADA